ncbi:Smad/fha domain, partial [Globisporangium splendens]
MKRKQQQQEDEGDEDGSKRLRYDRRNGQLALADDDAFGWCANLSYYCSFVSVKGGDAASEDTKPSTVEVVLDGVVDVEGFFERECEAEAQKLMEHAKTRCADLRREMQRSKQAIADSFVAEKETWLSQQDARFGTSLSKHTFQSFMHALIMLAHSMRRKFRAPNGLSMPKDPELSTTHAQVRFRATKQLALRLEADGRVFFTDLDSTNGSYINDESVEPHESQALSTTEPNKVSVGGSELLFTFTKRV